MRVDLLLVCHFDLLIRCLVHLGLFVFITGVGRAPVQVNDLITAHLLHLVLFHVTSVLLCRRHWHWRQVNAVGILLLHLMLKLVRIHGLINLPSESARRDGVDLVFGERVIAVTLCLKIVRCLGSTVSQIV